VIHFGQGYDSKEREKTIASFPENCVEIMDRGFCSKERIRNLSSRKNKFFVLIIKNNINLKA
jgi:transposase